MAGSGAQSMSGGGFPLGFWCERRIDVCPARPVGDCSAHEPVPPKEKCEG